MLKQLILRFSGWIEAPFRKGEIISERYQIIELIGTGGYGHSYLVNDLLLKECKVLKALRIHKRLTRSGKAGFEKEKQYLQLINHPDLPRFFESGMYKAIPYFTMEYISGKNFEQLIFEEGQRYSEKEAFKIAFMLLEIISHLHALGIVHRDIRIPNVLMDDSKIKLIDLGLAGMASELNPRKRIRTPSELRKELAVQADYYALGHFILFLLYSDYEHAEGSEEKSWEEELSLSDSARIIIRRLLQIETEYIRCKDIMDDIKQITGEE